MNISQFTTTILQPNEGFVLTQSDDAIDIKDRLVATTIALGANDSADNYKEITIAEGEAIKAEQERLIKEQNNEE